MMKALALYGLYSALAGHYMAPPRDHGSSRPHVMATGCIPLSYSQSCELPWAQEIPQCKCVRGWRVND
jgi:hypothetical protein